MEGAHHLVSVVQNGTSIHTPGIITTMRHITIIITTTIIIKSQKMKYPYQRRLH